MADGPSLIVVSNRLPVVVSTNEEGGWDTQRGSGGLITALEPVLEQRGGVWVGWPGVGGPVADLDRLLERAIAGSGYEVRSVTLTHQEHEDFYLGFANQVIWPLFHDFQTQCNFNPRFW